MAGAPPEGERPREPFPLEGEPVVSRLRAGRLGAASPFYECRQWGECIFFLFLFSQGQWSTNKLARTGGRCENGL